jgi:D-amino-acid oxidase
MSQDRDILVVGAGVSGLTTAVTLAEAGHSIKILSAGTGRATTSYAAGATWSPYLVEWTDRARGWAFHTLEVLRTLAADPRTGIRLVSGIDAARHPLAPPDWSDHLADFRECSAEELPAGFVAGWRYTAPVVDMPAYLDYLQGRALAAGVRFAEERVDRLDLAPLVVDCAGIGARELAPDPTLTPVRGQVVIVENPGITGWFVEEGDPPVYFFPQRDTVVLGGTSQAGDANTQPDPAVAALIVARCAEIDPRLTGARVLGHRVGLRPARPLVRLESESLGGTRVIHNYGHGGAGVTLSWGCAAQVLQELHRADGRPSPAKG